MLETLTGRLKWESTRDGIRVVIPARLSWSAIRGLLIDLVVYVAASFSIFIVAAFVAYFRGLSFRSYLNSAGVHSLLWGFLGCCTGLILVRMVSRLFGETVVTLSPAQIIIEYKIPLRRSKEVFPTATLHSFRFVERSRGVSVQNKIGQNEVQFGQTHWTRYFGAGVTREEAKALIAKMTEVYPFPSYLPIMSAPEAEVKQNVVLS